MALRRKKTDPTPPPSLESIDAQTKQLRWDSFRRRMTDQLEANEERLVGELKRRVADLKAQIKAPPAGGSDWPDRGRAAPGVEHLERQLEATRDHLDGVERRFKRMRKYYSKARAPDDFSPPYSSETGKPAETVKRFSLSACGFEDDWGAIPKRRYVLNPGDPVPPEKQAEFGCTVVPPSARFVWEEEVDDDDEAESRPDPKPQRVLSAEEKAVLAKAALNVPMGALAPLPAAAPRLQPAAAGVVDAPRDRGESDVAEDYSGLGPRR
jgi:hypothetical protein